MADIFALAGENLISPMVLFFALGFAAALARSERQVRDQASQIRDMERDMRQLQAAQRSLAQVQSQAGRALPSTGSTLALR